MDVLTMENFCQCNGGIQTKDRWYRKTLLDQRRHIPCPLAQWSLPIQLSSTLQYIFIEQVKSEICWMQKNGIKEEEDNIGKPSAKIEFCRLINKQIMERKKKWPLNSGNCSWKLFLDLATPTSVADMEICATDCRQSTNTRSCRVQRPDQYIFTC